MHPPPDWQTVRISHLDMTMAWAVCADAAMGQKGSISRVAARYEILASIVQKALNRVEAAMGGQPFFVVGMKRTARLTEHGHRFVERSNSLLDAWGATLSVASLT